MDLKDKFLEVGRKTKEVYVDALGITVVVKELFYGIRKQVDRMNAAGRTDEGRTLVLLHSCYDQDDNRIWSDKDKETLDKTPNANTEELFNVAWTLTFTQATPEEIDLIKKNVASIQN